MAKTIQLSDLLAGGNTPTALAAARKDTKVQANVQTLVAVATWDAETNRRTAQEFSDRGFDGIQTDKRASRYENVKRVKNMQKHGTLSTTVINIQKDITAILFYAANANEETKLALTLWDLSPDADEIYESLQKVSGGFTLDGKDAFLTSEAAGTGDEAVLVGYSVLVDDTFMESAKNRRKALSEYCELNPLKAGGDKAEYVARLRKKFGVDAAVLSPVGASESSD